MRRLLLALAALLAALLAPDMSAGAEDLGTHDPRVLEALALLDSSPATNNLHAVLDRNRVRIQFIPMAPGVYARYSVVRHMIEIDQRWREADATTMAAVIAHEATHAQDAVLEGHRRDPIDGRPDSRPPGERDLVVGERRLAKNRGEGAGKELAETLHRKQSYSGRPAIARGDAAQ